MASDMWGQHNFEFYNYYNFITIKSSFENGLLTYLDSNQMADLLTAVQLQFLGAKWVYWDPNYREICFYAVNWQGDDIGSVNDLVPNMCQATIPHHHHRLTKYVFNNTNTYLFFYIFV